jgi:signal transduction histidine kinase
VLIVYLDLESHLREGQSPSGRWDRKLHAKLVRRLRESGARAVVFDVLFSGADPDPVADAALAEEFRRGPPVFLAAETVRSGAVLADGSGARQRRLLLPHEPLREAAAGWGLAESAVDSDLVARELFEGLTREGVLSLPVAVARANGVELRSGARRWLRYQGPPLSLAHVSYSQALRVEETPDELFRGKIVLVGSRPAAGAVEDRRDEFRNPYRHWGDPDRFMPGVELQGTALLNLLRGEWLERLPVGVEAVLLMVSAVGLTVWMARASPVKALGLAVGTWVGLSGVAWLGFRSGSWFPWMLPGMVQIPMALGVSWILGFADWYREKRRLEERMQQLRRLETIGSLAGGLVHDLNNALGPVLMGLGLLKNRPMDPASQRMFQLMEGSVQRGVDMVRHVLLFARGHEVERLPVSMSVLLQELVVFLRGTLPARIEVNLLAPRGLWPILGNGPQTHQVLLNLCLNARDAMRHEGELIVSAENLEMSAEEGAGFRPKLAPGRYVVVTVCDSGEGMPIEVQTRLFEPFFTTKAEGRGNGLGLSTSLRLLELNRGGLRFESEMGQGTTFEVALPAAGDLPGVAALDAPKEIPAGRGEIVALVEPEEAFRGLLVDTLTAHGYRVVIGSTLAPLTSAVDLILYGGDDLDSVACTWLLGIRAQRGEPLLPILLTGQEALGLATSGQLGPVLVALPRPFRIETLLRRVRGLLDG